MKSKLPPSKNVEDRTGETSVWAAHRNPYVNPMINAQRKAEQAAVNQRDMARAKDMKGTPFARMLKGMDKPQPKANPADRIPIPTPRPDNSNPLPKVFRAINNKG